MVTQGQSQENVYFEECGVTEDKITNMSPKIIQDPVSLPKVK